MGQTDQRFEWILVDDGSTDNTPALVESFRDHSFPLQYLRKENGGKHTALNAAHPYLHGKYVLLLDSDDCLTEDAVEQVLTAWSRWEAVPEIGLVTFLKGTDPEHPNCYAPDENVPVSINGYRRVRVRSSDACEVIRTELFRQYPFPVYPGERFIAEGALWTRVGWTHKCVYVNRVIYLCEYLADGLTRAGRAMRIKNPRGVMFNANLGMRRDNPLKSRLKCGLLYTCHGFFAKMGYAEMRRSCDSKGLMTLCFPFGWVQYRLWKKKYN